MMRRLKNHKDIDFACSSATMMERPKENFDMAFGGITNSGNIMSVSNDTCHHRFLKKKITTTRRRLISLTEPVNCLSPKMISRSLSLPETVNLDEQVPETLSRTNTCYHPEISTLDLQSRLSQIPSREFLSSSVLEHRIQSRSCLRKIESTKSIEERHQLSNFFVKRVTDNIVRAKLRLESGPHPKEACRGNENETVSSNVKNGKSVLFQSKYCRESYFFSLLL